MNIDPDFFARISSVLERDERFAPAAYAFVSDALAETVERLGRARRKGAARHVSGAELSKGAADFAHEQFGPLAYDVLCEWGVRTTGDIGSIVFNMIDAGILSKTDEDTREDFDDVFDLRERLS